MTGTAPAHGVADQLRTVAAEQWREAVETCRAEGFVHFDVLDAVDEIGRSDEFAVICRLVDPIVWTGVQVHTRVPRSEPRLAGIASVFAGAEWHQRELHDFFGITFEGDDMSPLLNHTAGVHPLRKDFVLAARAAQPWPGAKEPGEASAAARRRMAPAGVPDAEVWGDRPASAPAPTPEEVAAAVGGGRVRRRR